jgi:LDH2 family malate/lactate/ureidoglycolate dehydrogenase
MSSSAFNEVSHMPRTFSIDALFTLVETILTNAGISGTQAAALARVITAGERDNCKSHGIYRIEGILRTLKSSKVDGRATPQMEAVAGAIVRVNAKCGFSNAAFEMGLPVLVERAQELGLAALVVNDCTHFAALWPEVEAITAHGLAAIAMCPSYASVAPWGGSKPLLGTNPLAFGWPRPGRDPYVFDFATSVVARGEIELHRRAGNPLPEGWAVDLNGNPTVDPTAALAGAMLPFGGHKGSAISTMIELLAGVMIGDMTSPEALEFLGTTIIAPRHGELLIALSPQKFAAGRSCNPFYQAELLLDAIAGQGARLPSERRYKARARAEINGITLTDTEVIGLERLLANGLEGIA